MQKKAGRESGGLPGQLQVVQRFGVVFSKAFPK